jgi:hypothetical protein
MPGFESIEHLADAMHADALRAVDMFREQRVSPMGVEEEFRGNHTNGIGHHYAAVWIVRSQVKYGGEPLPVMCGIKKDPYRAADQFSSARRAGLSLSAMFMAAEHAGAAEPSHIVIADINGGRLGIMTEHDHGPFRHRQRVTKGVIPASWFLSTSLNNSPEARTMAYDEWRADLETLLRTSE